MPTVHSEHIPRELKQRRQWVCWRAEERGGKLTKVPYSVHGGRAGADSPETWATFRDAVKHAKSAGMDGIGYVFAADDPYTGLDLDDCRDSETGDEEWARQILEELPSYTEFSPSGTGMHVFVKAALPDGGNRKGPLEMYDSGRFFTVTGNRVPETPAEIRGLQNELDALHRRVFPQEQAPAAPESADSVDRSAVTDEEILRRATAAKNGAKVADLWAGEWEGYGYSSQSEADQALCGYLAFWTGPDAERIANLVGQSGLYRSKWDRADYRQRTVQGALAGKTEFWSGPGNAPSNGRESRRNRSHLHAVGDSPEDETPEPAFRYTPGNKNLAIHASGAVSKIRKTKDGYDLVPQGFEAPHVREHIHVPGEDVQDGKRRYYLLEHNGVEVLCSNEELTRGSVWERIPGLEFLGADKPSMGDGAAIVLRLAQDAPTYTGHNTTGWQSFEDGSGHSRFGYLLPDGRALHTGDENVSRARTVGMPAGLRAQYKDAPAPASASDEEIREALHFVRLVTPARLQALLALGSSARSLSAGIRRAGLTTMIEGERSTGKTSMSALARSLTVPYSWPPKPEMSFNDTENALEKRIARLGSYPALVDDFNLPPNATQKVISDAERKIDLIVRNTYNDADMRGRLNRDTTERASSKVQTAAIITAERLPDTLQSGLRRMLLLPVEEDESDLDLLADSEQYAPALLALGHRLIIDLARRVDEHGFDHVSGEIRETHRYYMHRLRDELTAAMGGSLSQMFTSLPEIGAETLTGLYHLERAANLPEGELTGPALQSLTGALTEQAGRMEGRDEETGAGPFTQLAGKLAEHFRAGTPVPGTGSMPTRAVRRESADVPEKAPDLRRADADKAIPPHVWGCGEEDEESPRRPVTVAFVDEARGLVYLTESAMAAMLEWARKMPGCGHITNTTELGKAAEDEGWIKRRESKRRRTVKPRHRGDGKARALAVCAFRFAGEDEESPPEPQPETPQPESPQPTTPQPEPLQPEADNPESPESIAVEETPQSPPPSQSPQLPESPELSERVREVLAEPWAVKQAALCRKPGGDKLLRPLANSVGRVLDVRAEPERGEIFEIVKAHVRGEENAV